MEPENTEDDVDLANAVASVMQDLPKPVQSFLKGPERDVVVRELSAKYQLHVDQAGEFERAFILMLLGIETPDEFVSALTQVGLTPDIINGLAADLNTRVFIPLQEAEKRPAAAAPVAPVSAKPQPLPPPALDYQPTPVLPGSDITVPVSRSEPVSAPTAHEPEPVSIPQAMSAVPGTHPPGWHPAAAVHIFVPSHGAPQGQQVAITAAPPLTEPKTSVSSVAQPLPPTPAVSPDEIPAAEPRPAPVQPAPQRNYSADPYREPI